MFISAIDWLIAECTGGNQRNEINSLFNALLLWDISGTIARVSTPNLEMRWMQPNEWCKKKKHGVKKKEGKRDGWQRWDWWGHGHKEETLLSSPV